MLGCQKISRCAVVQEIRTDACSRIQAAAQVGSRAMRHGVIADTRTLGAPGVNDQRQVTESALFPIAHRQHCCYTCDEDASSSMSGSRRSTVLRAPGCAPGSHEQALNFLRSPGWRIPIGLLIFAHSDPSNRSSPRKRRFHCSAMRTSRRQYRHLIHRSITLSIMLLLCLSGYPPRHGG